MEGARGVRGDRLGDDLVYWGSILRSVMLLLSDGITLLK